MLELDNCCQTFLNYKTCEVYQYYNIHKYKVENKNKCATKIGMNKTSQNTKSKTEEKKHFQKLKNMVLCKKLQIACNQCRK